jgi:Xaa-Pro aminopeptidase
LYPADRLGRVSAVLTSGGTVGADAVLVTPGSDLRYLTGYNAKQLERLTCLVLPRSGDPVLLVPQLERPAALASPAAGLGIEIIGWAETVDPFALAADRLTAALGAQPGRVLVANRMWAEHALKLRDALPGAAVALADPVLRELRMRKDTAEVAALRRAGQAIDRVHRRMGEWLRPGRTEAEVGADIAEAILAAGHTSVDFVIVGSGPNSASPHHEVSDRTIMRGDMVVVDIGGTTPDGYCSDCTRTYVAGGEPKPEALEYYAVLQRAQDAACEAVKPGVTPEAVDAAAREIIAAAGYGDFFIHRTGHGIGLECHEEPYIVAGNTEPLEPGMAFSIEPGIYLPDEHGARIEDILVCTESGGERLNQVRRDLVVLPG